MALFRIKASRSPYRRAGFILGSAAWVDLPEDLALDRLAVLMRDPVVVMQGFVEGVWQAVQMADRLQMAKLSSAFAAFQAEGPSVVEPVDGATAPAEVPPIDNKALVEGAQNTAPEARTIVKPAPPKPPKPTAAKAKAKT